MKTYRITCDLEILAQEFGFEKYYVKDWQHISFMTKTPTAERDTPILFKSTGVKSVKASDTDCIDLYYYNDFINDESYLMILPNGYVVTNHWTDIDLFYELIINGLLERVE